MQLRPVSCISFSHFFGLARVNDVCADSNITRRRPYSGLVQDSRGIKDHGHQPVVNDRSHGFESFRVISCYFQPLAASSPATIDHYPLSCSSYLRNAKYSWHSRKTPRDAPLSCVHCRVFIVRSDWPRSTLHKSLRGSPVIIVKVPFCNFCSSSAELPSGEPLYKVESCFDSRQSQWYPLCAPTPSHTLSPWKIPV